MKKKVAIIGSGLAGLNCARLLQEEFDVTLFDKEKQVGGRIKSSYESEYIMDHGFQVFLPEYPEAKKAFHYKELDLQAFTPGALIRIKDKLYKFSDPLRRPQDIIATLSAPVGNIKDKLLILKLKVATKNPSDELKHISTKTYLQEFGFSNEIINTFFKPFFSGVFLERNLSTPAYFFCFLFDLFSQCNATVPRRGMMELPLNLSRQLSKANLRLGTEIKKISHKSVFIDNKEEEFDFVICAYDNTSTNFQKVTTDYFSTNKEIASNPTLYLNGNSDGVINHIAPMTKVNANYSPTEKFLWSVNLITPHQDSCVKIVTNELESWFPGSNFKHLERFKIEKALPGSSFYGQESMVKDGIYYCGDHMQDPSINGALKSGRLVAEHILATKS